MANKRDLERLDSSQLAALCKQVAYIPSADAPLIEEAWQLRQEWFRVVGPAPPFDYKANEIRLADEKALADRMADFLTATLWVTGDLIREGRNTHRYPQPQCDI